MACYCCVEGCKNNNHKETSKHFFRFPKNDEKRRNLWRKFARKNIKTTAVVCEDHFESHFMIQKDKKLKLTNEAVPTIFYNFQGERVTIDYDGEEYFGAEADEMKKIQQTLQDQEIIVIEAAFMNEQMKLDELKYRCRFCSEAREELIEISSFQAYNINISKLLQSFGLFLMVESDFFPNSVCEECFSQVVSLDNFIVKCKSSDQWLWGEIGKLKSIIPAVAPVIEIIETPEESENCSELIHDEGNLDSKDTQVQDYSTIIPFQNSHQTVNEEVENKIKGKRKTKKLKLSETAIIDTSCNKFALKTYDCEVCLQVYAGLKTFKTHICDVPEIKCDDCGDNFETAFALKSHRNHLHNDMRNFCPICKTVITANLAMFKKHKAKCNSDRIESVVCELCQKTFTTLHGYSVHKMFHDSKGKLDEDVLATKPRKKAEIICELCGKTYTTIG